MSRAGSEAAATSLPLHSWYGRRLVSRNRAVLALASLVAALCLVGRLPTPVGAGNAAQSSGGPPAAKIGPRVVAATADRRGTAVLVLLADEANLPAAQA